MVAITKYIILAPLVAALHINYPVVDGSNPKARTISKTTNALTFQVSKLNNAETRKTTTVTQAPNPEKGNEINILVHSLQTIETTLSSFAHTLKSFSDSTPPLRIDDEFIALALALEHATPPSTFPSLNAKETKNITAHISRVKRGIKPVLAGFARKSKLFPADYVRECEEAFEVLKEQSEGLEEGILSHVSVEGKEKKELHLEFRRVTALFSMGEKYFARLSRHHHDEDGKEKLDISSGMGVVISAETEVDEALYEITRTTQHLENAVNSIKDDDKDEIKKNTIDPPLKELENSFHKLADSDDLRRLTERESADRLALVQTVGYFVNESMDALVGKAVVLPEEFKTELSKRLEGLLDLGTEIAAVVRYGVAYDKQKELAFELEAVNDCIQWASDSFKPTDGKAIIIQGSDNVKSLKQANILHVQSVGKKAVSGLKSALEKLAMRIELR